MTDVFLGWQPKEVIAVVSVVGGLLMVTVITVFSIWQGMRKVEMELALKQDMIQRGFTPEQIRDVLRAKA